MALKTKIKNVIFRVFTILVILISAFICFIIISGAKGYAVVSNSMYPALKKGDVVFVRQTDFADLQVNDIVTVNFKKNEGTFTHRIAEKDESAGLIYTKGDNVSMRDQAPSEKEQIAGKVWFSIPFMGYLAMGLGNKTVLVILLGAVIVLSAAGSLLVNAKKKKDRGDKNEQQKKEF